MNYDLDWDDCDNEYVVQTHWSSDAKYIMFATQSLEEAINILYGLEYTGKL